MAKPIFTVGLPSESFRTLEDWNLLELELKNKFKDYDTLLYTHNGDEVKFDCFFEKDFNKVKYEQLKKIIKDKMQEL